MFSIVYKLYKFFVASIIIIPLVVLGAPMRPKTNMAMPVGRSEVLNKNLRSQMPGNSFIFCALNAIISNVLKVKLKRQ